MKKLKISDKQQYIKNAFEAFDNGHPGLFDAAIADGVRFNDVHPDKPSGSTLIEKILIQGPSFNPDRKKLNSPYFSLESPKAPFIESLIRSGWKPDRFLSNGQLPLHQVMNSPSGDEAARCLIRNGVDVNQLNEKGESPLSYVFNSMIMRPYEEVLRQLIHRGARFADKEEEQKSMMKALRSNHVSLINILLDKWSGFDPNLPLKYSSRQKIYAPTLFWGAIYFGFIKPKDLILWETQGADATVTDNHKTGVLHALLDRIENGTPQGSHVSNNFGSKKPNFILQNLKEHSGMFADLGKMGARWTLKRKGGLCPFERLKALILENDIDPETATLEKWLGIDNAYIIQSQESKERLMGLPQAEEKIEEEAVSKIKSRRRL